MVLKHVLNPSFEDDVAEEVSLEESACKVAENQEVEEEGPIKGDSQNDILTIAGGHSCFAQSTFNLENRGSLSEAG